MIVAPNEPPSASAVMPSYKSSQGRPFYLTKKSIGAAGEGRMPASNIERRFMLVRTSVRRLIFRLQRNRDF